MDSPVWPKYTITKLEAAQQQLRVAISLWFQGANTIAIHTLAGAAHQIIHDILKKNGIEHFLFDSQIIKDEYRQQFINHLKKEINFFKHADKDPEGVIDFAPKMSEVFILVTLLGLESLKIDKNPTEKAFLVWFNLQHPDLLTEKGRQQFTNTDDFKYIKSMNPKEFFELFIIASERFTHIG